MQSSLAVTALLMGLVGGPHCVAMCGAACAGLGQAAGQGRPQTLWVFQLGRLTGYSALGGLAAAGVQGLGWLTVHSAALRPFWSLLHLAAMAVGVWLMLQARQPLWLEQPARQVWTKVRQWTSRRGNTTPALVGLLWAFMPCGLLYSALMVAALSNHALEGSLTMALFAAGSSLSLLAGPWLWLRLQAVGDGAWGMRLSGAALFGVSGWGLWMGLVHDQAPWCVAPV